MIECWIKTSSLFLLHFNCWCIVQNLKHRLQCSKNYYSLSEEDKGQSPSLCGATTTDQLNKIKCTLQYYIHTWHAIYSKNSRWDPHLWQKSTNSQQHPLSELLVHTNHRLTLTFTHLLLRLMHKMDILLSLSITALDPAD